jgi:hypothetical protein
MPLQGIPQSRHQKQFFKITGKNPTYILAAQTMNESVQVWKNRISDSSV